jgi:uncharacterized protein (TIGR02646 family)
MIKIIRTECPSVLLGSPTDRDNYSDKDVVKALYIMQNGKCCYCETKIPDSKQGKSVEHHLPRSRDKNKEKVNSWENLLLACPKCNECKGDEYPVNEENKPLILDPSNENINPEDHLEFIISLDKPAEYGCVITRNQSDFGRETVKYITNLNSKIIATNRRKLLRRLHEYYLALLEAHDDNDPQRVSDWRCKILDQDAPTAEYCACAREFIRKKDIREIFPSR